jgi:hypothetical protein
MPSLSVWEGNERRSVVFLKYLDGNGEPGRRVR